MLCGQASAWPARLSSSPLCHTARPSPPSLADLPQLPASVTEQLVLSTAAQLLRTATSLDHAAVGQARSILTLAPPEAKVRVCERVRGASVAGSVYLRLSNI